MSKCLSTACFESEGKQEKVRIVNFYKIKISAEDFIAYYLPLLTEIFLRT